MILEATNTISGKMAKATAIIDGKVEDLFIAKSIEANAEKNKTEINVLGSVVSKNKSTGAKLSGTLKLYYVESLFREIMAEYIKTGRDLYFTMIVENEDPNGVLGNQTVALYNCNIDNVTLAKFDVDSEVLDEEIKFTFDNVDILKSFNKLY